MKAAIYSRKSRFTGKGESVENQIQICQEYAIKSLGCCLEDFIIYEDEGYSGGNTNRPQFQRMLKAARNKQLDIIICYRLDRISRDVSDFSQLINELDRNNINFISVREQFDTTKPMGRAMMYVASVFSQLERETIAERIRDNMLQLSKTGRWLGGTTPTGYKSEAVVTNDAFGKEHRLFKLVAIPEQVAIIKLIYDKYISLNSISMVEKYLTQNKIGTKNGVDFGRFSIRFILSNPVYAIADKYLFEYLSSNCYDLYSNIEEFNGINGLMGYNKTSQNDSKNSERYRACCEWVIAVGLHPGIITSKVWIETQERLLQNKSKAYRKVKNTKSLLSGILRCSSCGSFMRPKALKRLNAEGETIFYYMCELKEKSRGLRCKVQNLQGNTLDYLVMDKLGQFIANYPPIFDDMNFKGTRDLNKRTQQHNEIQLLQDKLASSDLQIKNLARLISKEENEKIQAALLFQLEKIYEDIEKYKSGISELNSFDVQSENSYQYLKRLNQSSSLEGKSIWDMITVQEKRLILKSVIDKIVWDGVKLDVFLSGDKCLLQEKDMFPQ